MINIILENQVRLEKNIRSKIKQGKKINILVLESTSNIAKVSLLSEIQRAVSEFNVSVLSYDQSQVSINLYQSIGIKQIFCKTIDEAVNQEDVDILFIDNPHYHYEFIKPTYDFYTKITASVFEKVLICYIPYAYISVSSHEAYTDFFHNYSWKFFLESYFHLIELKKHTKQIKRLPNQVITGHPYLDPYFTDSFDFNKDLKNKGDSKIRIAWCPHHNKDFYGVVSISEQEEVLRRVLEHNKEIEIYFRPHPNLIAAMKSSIHQESKDYQTLLTNDTLDIFENYWLKHDRVIYFDKGPVYQLFKSSDLIVHNCGGYQMEAVASGANIINLVNKGILNSHILQYEELQDFCSSKIDFEKSLNKSLSKPHGKNDRFIGCEEIPSAGNLIVNHLKRVLF